MKENEEGSHEEQVEETTEQLDEAIASDVAAGEEEDLKGDANKPSKKSEKREGIQYDSKKPKWWKALCQKPSKAQKKAKTEILRDLRLPRIPYGSFIQWDDVFPTTGKDNIWLELGFGRGENFLALAHRKTRTISLVGAEIHQGMS